LAAFEVITEEIATRIVSIYRAGEEADKVKGQKAPGLSI
jgi:hypothetical protein